MNILGVDYGTNNIGLAWVNTDLGVVLPYGKIKNQISNIKNDELINLINAEKIDKVIVGLPVGLDGTENANTARVKKFADELRAQITVPVEFFDERFSSQQADRMGNGVSRDEKAAMVILEGYLDKLKRS